MSTRVGKWTGPCDSDWMSGRTAKAATGQKSARTRAAILEAARELFGAMGYDRTTIRDVAQQASIDPSMVIRYFGSKEELFAEAATFDLRMPDLSHVPARTAGVALVRHFLDIWEGKGAVPGMVVLLRSAASSEQAAKRMRSVFTSQVMPAIAKLGSREHAAERAGLIVSQLLGVAFLRHIVRLEPIASASPDVLASRIGPTIQRYLTADLL